MTTLRQEIDRWKADLRNDLTSHLGTPPPASAVGPGPRDLRL
jgi:hypothetical protein